MKKLLAFVFSISLTSALFAATLPFELNIKGHGDKVVKYFNEHAGTFKLVYYVTNGQLMPSQ
jgi:hypothetical protein